MTATLQVAARIACLPLAAFFAFVGYWKAFGPIAALAQHHAWVAGWPDWFARAIGWSELACATALLVSSAGGLSGIAMCAALVLVINQLAALAVHASRGEAATMGQQNLIIIAALGLIALCASLTRGRASP
jgi:DoxX-like family